MVSHHDHSDDSSHKRGRDTDEECSPYDDSEAPCSPVAQENTSWKRPRRALPPLYVPPRDMGAVVHLTSSSSSSEPSSPSMSCSPDALSHSTEVRIKRSSVKMVDASGMFGAERSDDDKSAGEKGCRCGRTKCLKQYCACFRSDLRCTESCFCVSCYNDGKHEKERGAAIRHIRMHHYGAFKGTALELEDQQVYTPRGTLRTVRGCRCKRSNCQKKYCECFAAGLKCSANCVCEGCRNGNDSSSNGNGMLPQALAKLAKQQPKKAPAVQKKYDNNFKSKKPAEKRSMDRAEKALLSGPRASVKVGSAAPATTVPISRELGGIQCMPLTREKSGVEMNAMSMTRERSGLDGLQRERSELEGLQRERSGLDSIQREKSGIEIPEEEMDNYLASFLATTPKGQIVPMLVQVSEEGAVAQEGPWTNASAAPMNADTLLRNLSGFSMTGLDMSSRQASGLPLSRQTSGLPFVGDEPPRFGRMFSSTYFSKLSPLCSPVAGNGGWVQEYGADQDREICLSRQVTCSNESKWGLAAAAATEDLLLA